MATLGEALKDARSKAKLSLKQVAGQTGITNSRLSKMERDQIPCRIEEVKKLVDLYRSPAIEFFVVAGYLTAEDLRNYQRAFHGIDKLTLEEREHIQRTIDLLTMRKE